MRGGDKRMNSVLKRSHLRCLEDICVGLFTQQTEHFDLEFRREVGASEVAPGVVSRKVEARW